MNKILMTILLLTLSAPTLAKDEYYLEYNRPGERTATRYGPMKSLQECQEKMAKFLGKFGDKIINPRCIKK